MEPAYFHNFYITNDYTGEYKQWYDNGDGQLFLKINYVNGLKEGLHESWYEDGQLRIHCNYLNGIRNGLYEEWYKNGDLYEKCIYLNDHKTEPYIIRI